MITHYPDIVLAAYVEDDPNIDRQAVETHTSICDLCGAELAAYRALKAALSDPNVHAFAARERMGRRTFDVKSVRRWLEGRSPTEDHNTFKVLLTKPVDEWADYLSGRPSLQTKGLIIGLTSTAHDNLKRKPRLALKVLDIAETLAKRLDDSLVIAEQCAAIAKERANSLRVLGRHTQALEELDWAERYLAELPGPAYDLLFVEWARATVLFSMTRYTDALPIVQKVIPAFDTFGDVSHANQARILEANIACEQGDVSRALSTYFELLHYFANAENRALMATLNGNIAECEVRLDHPESAHLHAEEAARLFEELGLRTERARVRWTVGYELMRRNFLSEALDVLHSAATEFEALGLVIEAGKVGLDIVECHLRAAEWEPAERLSRYLTGLFDRKEAPLHHVRAYTQLREAVEARTATIELCAELRVVVAAEPANADTQIA